jgi:divalent metal cation (Fe/Co/Zn/Cd) transporter
LQTIELKVNDHRRRALTLSYLTFGSNLLEGTLSVGFAIATSSPALLGFGLDSFVESLSATVIIWRFWRVSESAADERRERTAIRLVGVSLAVLGLYVVYEAITALYDKLPPERSAIGMIIALVSIAVMPTLYLLKRRTAAALKSQSLATDAKQTLACILLSVALLLGSGLYYVTGVWQADPIAALVIAAFLLRESYKAWKEQKLCC